MTSRVKTTAETAWPYRLLTLGPARISLAGGTLRFEGLCGDSLAETPVGAVEEISVRRSLFWSRLTVRLSDGTERSLGGLQAREAMRVRDAVVAENARRATEVGPLLKRLESRLSELFSAGQYVRYRESRELHGAIVSTVRKCGALVQRHLEPAAREAVGRMAALVPEDAFEAARSRANRGFLAATVAGVRAAALRTPSRPLTDEQAAAVATDEDVTLVLAGAGTGKTSVIVGKVAHLVRNLDISPDDNLVLAFNRKAAEEVRERLQGDLSGAGVHTFHSFGRRVIAQSNEAPTVSKLAEDERALSRAITGIVDGLLKDPEQSRAVLNFIAYHHVPYRSPFDFDTSVEYYEYARRVELRTFSGDLVKSFEELSIANYLTEHGVRFEYERPYQASTATQQHGQYRPDFFLPEHGIYIEHFALNERGIPPAGWEGYADGVEWKRGTHRVYGTKLIETCSWQHRQGILLETLRSQLEQEGVEFTQVPTQTLIGQLARERTSRLASLLATFLHHVKGGDLGDDELRAIARTTGDRRRNESFLDVFDQGLRPL